MAFTVTTKTVVEATWNEVIQCIIDTTGTSLPAGAEPSVTYTDTGVTFIIESDSPVQQPALTSDKPKEPEPTLEPTPEETNNFGITPSTKLPRKTGEYSVRRRTGTRASATKLTMDQALTYMEEHPPEEDWIILLNGEEFVVAQESPATAPSSETTQPAPDFPDAEPVKTVDPEPLSVDQQVAAEKELLDADVDGLFRADGGDMVFGEPESAEVETKPVSQDSPPKSADEPMSGFDNITDFTFPETE